jgi:hypothetical protein
MSDDPNGMRMRYSRERRLARAAPDVRALYERRAEGKRGFLSFLKGNRNLSVLFLTIVVFAVIGSLYAFLSRESGGKKVGAYQAIVSAKLEDGEVIVNLKLSSNALFGKKGGDTVLVRTSTDGATFSAREFALSGAKEELFFFRVPVENEPTAIECLISVGGSQIDLTVPLRGAGPAASAGP